jgi:hypothetical protein
VSAVFIGDSHEESQATRPGVLKDLSHGLLRCDSQQEQRVQEARNVFANESEVKIGRHFWRSEGVLQKRHADVSNLWSGNRLKFGRMLCRSATASF